MDYLLSHEDDYLYFIDIKADMSDTEAAHAEYLAYANKLRGATAWGGQVEIQALSQCYNCNFEIYQALPRRSSSAESTETLPTHEISITKIKNQKSKTIFLAYSHGNHYDIVLDVEEIERLAYYQKLVHHSIDTFFQREMERKDYFLRDLAFEQPTDPLTPVQALESYDNRQWKIWQGQLQKEKSSDEQMARRIIAEETGTAAVDDGSWSVAGASSKSKNKNKNKANDSLAIQQAEMLAEISRQNSPHSDLDSQLARSLDKDLNDPTSSTISQDQMDADERLARELMDEQVALELSRELNPDTSLQPAQTTIPGGVPMKYAKGKPITPAKPPTSYSSTSASHGATTPSSTSDSTIVDDDGFVPSSKKARSLAAKASAAAKKEAEAEAKRKEMERENAAKREKEAAEKEKAKAAAAAAASAPKSTPAPSNVWASIAQGTVSPTASSNPSATLPAEKEKTATTGAPIAKQTSFAPSTSSQASTSHTDSSSKTDYPNAKNKSDLNATPSQSKPKSPNETCIVSIPIGTGPVGKLPIETISKETGTPNARLESPTSPAEPTAPTNTVSTSIAPTAPEATSVAPTQNKMDEKRGFESRKPGDESRNGPRNARQGHKESGHPRSGRGPQSGSSYATRGVGRGYPPKQPPVYAPVGQKRNEPPSAIPASVPTAPSDSTQTTPSNSNSETTAPSIAEQRTTHTTLSASSAPYVASTEPPTAQPTSTEYQTYHQYQMNQSYENQNSPYAGFPQYPYPQHPGYHQHLAYQPMYQGHYQQQYHPEQMAHYQHYQHYQPYQPYQQPMHGTYGPDSSSISDTAPLLNPERQ